MTNPDLLRRAALPRATAILAVSISALAALLPAMPAAAQVFGPPAPVSNIVKPSGNAPDYGVDVADDGAGHLVAVWWGSEAIAGAAGTDTDIAVARSSDNGVTWTDPVALNSNAASDSSSDGDPQIVTDGNGNWVTVWRAFGVPGFGSDGDLFYSRSTDNGVSWSPMQALNSDAAADSLQAYAVHVAADPNGNIVVVYENGSPVVDHEILYTRSTDAGVSWSAVQPLDSNAFVDTSSDQAPAITTDRNGNWIVAWTRDGNGSYGNDFDLFHAQSTDDGASWTTPAPLNDALGDDGSDDNVDLAADASGHIVAVWVSSSTLGGTLGTDMDVLAASSDDGGLSWSAPLVVNSYATTDSGSDAEDSFPHIATDGAGSWIASWTSGHAVAGDSGPDFGLLYSRSLDTGASWSSAARLSNGTPDLSGDYDVVLLPRGMGNWRAVWWSYDDLDRKTGSDSDILTASSSDNAATWDDVTWVNSNAPSDPYETSPDIATDGSVWLAVFDSADGFDGSVTLTNSIAVARSTDAGVTWSDAVPVETDAGTATRADTGARIATDGSNWNVVWTDSYTTILTSRSTDGGLTWSPPVLLSNSGVINLNATITTSGSEWIAAWSHLQTYASPEFDVLYARSSDGGATWSAPSFLNTNGAGDSGQDSSPQLAASGSRWIAVWTTTENLGGTIGTEGDIAFATSSDDGASWSAPQPLNTNAATDSGLDQDPRISTDGSGHWVAVWASGDSLGGTLGSDLDILVSRSSDDGASWSAPQPLQSNAATDSGGDDQPRLVNDGAGHWTALWRSNDSLGGSKGTDADILVARSTDDGATWSAPEVLVANALGDTGDDSNAAIASDHSGDWAALFQSTDGFGGVGNDGVSNVWGVTATLAGDCSSDDDCDDGDPCTQDSCAFAGCANVAAPAVDCRAGSKSLLLAKSSGSLIWKLSGGDATTQADFGDPTQTAAYTMCIYDETGTRMKLEVPSGSAWKPISTRGYKYKDAAGSADGVQSMLLKGSAAAKSKALLKAGGGNLGIAPLPWTGDVAVQLHNSASGLCWGSVFGSEDVLVNDAGKGLFKAKAH